MPGAEAGEVAVRLGELARHVGAQLLGDPECLIERVDTIQDATGGAICFLANPKYRKHLAHTRASAVILAAGDRDACPVNALVCDNPYLSYARISGLLYPRPRHPAGIHPSAVVAQSARIDDGVWIGPCAVLGEGVRIGAGSYIGPGCVIERDSRIGAGSRLVANVVVCSGSVIGERALLHPGVVIGSDGFGLANDGGGWVKVPQLGGVVIGDDVEIGANTTIDRGALRDTRIESGVKLDNQIQIAHNVRIGRDTAIAGCVGIAGSTTIGSNCTLGGGVGVVGHLELGDNTHFSAQTLVTRSFPEPGYYSGNFPALPNGEWKKATVRTRQLDEMARRLRRLERRLLELESVRHGDDDT